MISSIYTLFHFFEMYLTAMFYNLAITYAYQPITLYKLPQATLSIVAFQKELNTLHV